MKQLLKFELQKILCKRFSILSIIIILLFSLLLSVSTLQNMYAFQDGQEGTGTAAVQIDKAIAERYAGSLTDEKVQQMMTEFRPTQDLHGLNAKYLYQNAIQSAVFARFSDLDGNWNGQTVSDVFGNEAITVGYVNGWLNASQDLAKVCLALALVLILLIAPVFSGEYNGVEHIILTSKYGKTKCTTAKVIASFLTAIALTTCVLVFHLGCAWIFYGTDGLHGSILFAPVEFTENYIPFNITCGTVLCYQILLAFASAISVTGITLIFSAVCRNQMLAFVVPAVLYVLPMLLPISEMTALYRIFVLLPVYDAQYISIMSVAQFRNGLLYAIWAVPVSIIFAVMGAVFSRKIFTTHQVS